MDTPRALGPRLLPKHAFGPGVRAGPGRVDVKLAPDRADREGTEVCTLRARREPLEPYDDRQAG